MCGQAGSPTPTPWKDQLLRYTQSKSKRLAPRCGGPGKVPGAPLISSNLIPTVDTGGGFILRFERLELGEVRQQSGNMHTWDPRGFILLKVLPGHCGWLIRSK